MQRLLTAFLAIAAIGYSTFAAADFAAFDKKKFEGLVKSNATVVVHTHEWWCPTCRVQANVLQALQKEPKFANVTLLRASAGGDRETLEPMKVTSRSIILVFSGGKEVGRLNWVTDEAQIRALLEQAVAQAGG
jgi:thiol-disulfide isomerase/thioredoxin